MGQVKLPYGPVRLVVDALGFQDGRLVQFEIWMRKGGEEKLIDQVNGVVRGGEGRLHGYLHKKNIKPHYQ